MSTIQAFFSIGTHSFISYLTIIVDYQQLFKCSILCLTTPLRHLVSARNDERMNAGIVQSNLCWKIHNKYVFHVNIHILVLKYLVQIQIIQNQFKISEGGKWNSHQMPRAYNSRMVKKYRICPIRIEIIHGRHRVVQIYTRAGPLYSEILPLAFARGKIRI